MYNVNIYEFSYVKLYTQTSKCMGCAQFNVNVAFRYTLIGYWYSLNDDMYVKMCLFPACFPGVAVDTGGYYNTARETDRSDGHNVYDVIQTDPV